jgi:AcrR family transcriptional regulator
MMGPVHAASGLRRAPVQRRSAERLGRILDAAATLLDEGGYEELSTRTVAARAGVPIGSVYRFFPNKRAVADALARRNLDEYVIRVSARLAEPAADPGWRSAIDIVIDEYLAMKRTVPGFALVDFGIPVPDARGAANDRVADRLRALLAVHLGLDPGDRGLALVFTVGVEAADALLQLAFRTDPAGDPLVVAETKALLHAYLARTLDGAGTEAGTADG